MKSFRFGMFAMLAIPLSLLSLARAAHAQDSLKSGEKINGYTVGEALVKHPKTRIVTFTGSYKGGMALVKMAKQRDEPIPVFAEMGSINPTILLPEAIENRYQQIAEQYAASITLGAGQFCTNPGLILGVDGDDKGA